MPTQVNYPVKVLIIDDHPVVRAGLTSMLSKRPDIEVVGSSPGGEEAVELVRQRNPDVLLLDLRMPGMSGVEVLQALGRIGHRSRAIVLTSYETDEDIYRAFQAGAQGYLLKDTPLVKMIEAIMTVHSGKRFVPGHIALRLAERMMRTDLTARELEILRLVAKGPTNKQIAKTLGISGNTVRNHVNSIIEKLEVADRTEAATKAIQRGIITADE